ncbi:hypothetical protein LZ30DRAFT_462851 [Colletotrichum cereale]|nr:hypothetical protein LZ30DRAFT_462851 [Colletotrichum cereale]
MPSFSTQCRLFPPPKTHAKENAHLTDEPLFSSSWRGGGVPMKAGKLMAVAGCRRDNRQQGTISRQHAASGVPRQSSYSEHPRPAGSPQVPFSGRLLADHPPSARRGSQSQTRSERLGPWHTSVPGASVDILAEGEKEEDSEPRGPLTVAGWFFASAPPPSYRTLPPSQASSFLFWVTFPPARILLAPSVKRSVFCVHTPVRGDSHEH